MEGLGVDQIIVLKLTLTKQGEMVSLTTSGGSNEYGNESFGFI
jgi:hypothetical protein